MEVNTSISLEWKKEGQHIYLVHDNREKFMIMTWTRIAKEQRHMIKREVSGEEYGAKAIFNLSRWLLNNINLVML